MCLMTNAFRSAVGKPLIFFSITWSLFSFSWWSPVAVANALPKIPAVPDSGLFIFAVLNVEEDCGIIGKRGLETEEAALDFRSWGSGPVPKVNDGSLPMSLAAPTDEDSLEVHVPGEEPKLLKLPNVRVVEETCLIESPRLQRELLLRLMKKKPNLLRQCFCESLMQR